MSRHSDIIINPILSDLRILLFLNLCIPLHVHGIIHNIIGIFIDRKNQHSYFQISAHALIFCLFRVNIFNGLSVKHQIVFTM